MGVTRIQNKHYYLTHPQTKWCCYSTIIKIFLVYQNISTEEHLDLGWDEIYKIIKGICSGLDALHEEKIIHLDLKPQNVLMDGNMEPKIVDFGFARQLGENKSKIYTERATGTV